VSFVKHLVFHNLLLHEIRLKCQNEQRNKLARHVAVRIVQAYGVVSSRLDEKTQKTLNKPERFEAFELKELLRHAATGVTRILR